MQGLGHLVFRPHVWSWGFLALLVVFTATFRRTGIFWTSDFQINRVGTVTSEPQQRKEHTWGAQMSQSPLALISCPKGQKDSGGRSTPLPAPQQGIRPLDSQPTAQGNVSRKEAKGLILSRKSQLWVIASMLGAPDSNHKVK